MGLPNTKPLHGPATAHAQGVSRRMHAVLRHPGLLIAGLCLILYLVGNGWISLWDRDEPRYAQATREMLRSGNFVVPTFNGEPRYHKPVLIYWVMAAAYQLFGENEFAARFFSAVAGMATCLLTYRLGTRMYGRAVGLSAGLMLAVAPLMIIESKLATPDALLLTVLLGAFSCLWELYASGPSWHWSLGFWGLMGTALLIKGPVGPAVVLMTVLAWLVLGRDGRVLARLNWLAGMATLLIVTLPWGLAVYHATGGEFYREALGKHVIGRSLEPMDNHSGFPGYYLVTALAGLCPWSVGLPLALGGVRQWARERGPGSFLAAWVVGPMLMLELVRTKLPHYYLPAYPAWAILLARGLVQFHESGNRLVASRRGLVRFAGLVGGGATVALGLVGFVTMLGPPELRPSVLGFAATLGLGSLVAGALFLWQLDRGGWAALVATWGTLGLVASAWLLPAAERCRIERRAALALRARAGDHTRIVLHTFREPSVIFYLGKPVPILTAEEALRRYVRDRGPVYTLLRAQDLARLARHPAIQIETCEKIEGLKISQTERLSIMVARLNRPPTRDRTTASMTVWRDTRE